MKKHVFIWALPRWGRGGVETLAQMVCGSSSVNKHIFFHPRAPLSLICTPIQFVQSNTKSTVVTIVVNLIVLSAIKEIKLELAHRRNLLATGGGLVSKSPFCIFHISLSSLVSISLFCIRSHFFPQVGMVNLALANLCRANLAKQS